MMLVGIKQAIVNQVAPTPIHGRMNYRVHYVLDDLPGEPMVAQVDSEAIYPDAQPGDQVLITFDSGTAVNIIKQMY